MNENIDCAISYSQVGSLAALHMGKRGHTVELYEYREGDKIAILSRFDDFY